MISVDSLLGPLALLAAVLVASRFLFDVFIFHRLQQAIDRSTKHMKEELSNELEAKYYNLMRYCIKTDVIEYRQESIRDQVLHELERLARDLKRLRKQQCSSQGAPGFEFGESGQGQDPVV